MKDNKPIITPDVFPHINLDTDNMEPITEEKIKTGCAFMLYFLCMNEILKHIE